MATTVIFPNGQQLSSTGLTVDTLFALAQPILCGVLGFAVNDPLRNTAVRKEYNTQGAPAWVIGQDVAFIQILEDTSTYEELRDVSYVSQDDTNLGQVTNYTRVWKVTFITRGPNAFDRMRLIKSALLLDWVHDSFATSNLYMVPDLPSTVRIPEEFESQWWERCDLATSFYEQINETLSNVGIIESVELKVYDSQGLKLDKTYTS